MTELLLLATVIIGFAIMLGWRPQQKRLAFLFIWFLVAPTLFTCTAQYVFSAYQSLPLIERLLFLAAAPFFALFMVSAMFPKNAWLKRLNATLFNLFIFALTLPVRIMWRSVRLIFTRERFVRHLSAHEAVVGNRPPTRAAPMPPPGGDE